MTVGELIEAGTFCDSVEIVVRESGFGKWIQGYRIGKEIDMFPCEYTVELRETITGKHIYPKQIDGKNQPRLTKGEIRDVYKLMNLPMKLIKKDVSKLPERVANLKVANFQPRHIPSFHGEQLTHNEFLLEINAFPEGFVPEKNIETKAAVKTEPDEQVEGQMNIMDFLEV